MSANGIEAGKAFVKFLLDDKDLSKGLAKVGKKLQSVGSIGLAATTPLIGAFTAATVAALDFGDGIGDMAARTGIAADQLSALQFAADQSDVSITALERGIKKMTVNIGSAINGTGTFAGTLASLNVGIAELQGLTPDQQFLRISDALAKVEDPAQRAALAQKAFGGASRELLPLLQQGASSIQAMMIRAEELGVVLTEQDVAALGELDQALKVAKTQLLGFSVQIGAAISGELTDFLKWTQDVGVQVISFAKDNRELVITIAKVTAAIAVVSAAVVGLGVVMTAMAAHPVLAFLAAVAVAFVVVDEVVKRLNESLGTQLETLRLMAPGLALVKDAAEWAGLLPGGDGQTPTVDIAAEAQKIQAQIESSLSNASTPMGGGSATAMEKAVSDVVTAAQNSEAFDTLIKIEEGVLAVLTRIERKRGGMIVGPS